jgi:hypothetical protein
MTRFPQKVRHDAPLSWMHMLFLVNVWEIRPCTAHPSGGTVRRVLDNALRKCRSHAGGLGMYLNIKGQYERYYFCHIRKCGGTSVNKIFLNAFDNESGFLFQEINKGNVVYYNGLIFSGHTLNYLKEGKFLYAFSHTPLHQIELPERTFVFTSFRDPCQRVVSHYKNLLRWREIEDGNPDREKELTWLGDTFSNFLDNIPKEHLLRQLYMFSPSCNVKEAFERIRSLNSYFFLEDIERSLSILSTVFNTNLRNGNYNKSKIEVSITSKESVRLRAMLKDEYILMKRLRQGYNTHCFPMSATAAGL